MRLYVPDIDKDRQDLFSENSGLLGMGDMEKGLGSIQG